MNDKKLVRLCWNTEAWRKPSGWQGKSRNKGTHEGRNGYGGEEWLLDPTKRIGRFMYGYIEMPESQRKTHEGSTFDLSLYSIDGDTHQRWYVGDIKNVTILTDEECEAIRNEYRSRGWLPLMRRQLLEVGANVSCLRKYGHWNNVKFTPSDAHVLATPRLLFPRGNTLRVARYKMINLPSHLGLGPDWTFQHGGTLRKPSIPRTPSRRTRQALSDLHARIHAGAKVHLERAYGKRRVRVESPLPMGQSIDIVVQRGRSKYTFYEVKTAPSIRLCIREALSQLLEYACYPDARRADKLVVIGPHRITPDAKSYLRLLRDRFHLPIYYQFFDVEQGRLMKPLQ